MYQIILCSKRNEVSELRRINQSAHCIKLTRHSTYLGEPYSQVLYWSRFKFCFFPLRLAMMCRYGSHSACHVPRGVVPGACRAGESYNLLARKVKK